MTNVLAKAPLRPGQQDDHRQHYDLACQLYSAAVQADDHSSLVKALRQARLAYEIKPGFIPGLNLLARIEMQRGRQQEAEFWIDSGLALKPDSASLLYSAGHIALSGNKLEKAADYFERSARISRVATKSVNSLAHIKFLQGKYVEAFRLYQELVKTQARDKQIRAKLFESSSFILADFYSEELEQDLLRYLDFPDMDYGLLRPLATSLLKHKLRLSEAGCPLDPADIISDTLLLKCMTRFHFCDPLIERLLITLRQSLLLSCSRTLSIRPVEFPLIAAIAQQVQLNESVWYCTTQEESIVGQLVNIAEKLLNIKNISSVDLYPVLSLVFMYRPLNQAEFLPAIALKKIQWPESLDNFIRSTIHENKNLQKAALHIPSLSPAEDVTSHAVMHQYNENPYPRWIDIGYNNPANYRASLQAAFPSADFSSLPAENAQVLVAGCGTGRHAIRLAQYFKPLKITALDLSTTALAYASYQAQKRGHTDIRFIQGDLLNTAMLNQKFDVIECSGVLHHMQTPRSGLQTLAACLKPGGVIKIALYSRTARQRISALRNMLNGHIPSSVNNMRLVREALLQKSLPGDWSDIYNSPDFYNLSACRDLLFHVQEHTFDATELEDFTASAGLSFLGMLPPPGFTLPAGQSTSELTCSQWAALEQKNPALFAGMYQFYVQRPLTAAS